MKRLMTIVCLSSTSLLLTIACKSNPVAEGEMPLTQVPAAESTDGMTTTTTASEEPLSADTSASATSMPEEPTLPSSSAMSEESSSSVSDSSASVPDEVTKVAGLGASSSGRSR